MSNAQLRHETVCTAQTDRRSLLTLAAIFLLGVLWLYGAAAHAEERVLSDPGPRIGTHSNLIPQCSAEAFCDTGDEPTLRRFSLTRQLGKQSNTFLIFTGTELRLKMVF